MMTTTAKRGRPAKTAEPRKNALLPEDAVEAPVSPSTADLVPPLDLTLPELKIVMEAMERLPGTPENVDVYYKIVTYRDALKGSK